MYHQATDEVKRAMATFATSVEDGLALVTAGERGHWNTMTIGWGSAGTLWSTPTVTTYVHPNRHTHQFLLDSDWFTVQLFGPEHKRDCAILGSRSGRDGDKVALTSLTPKPLEHGVTFEEARLTIVCHKIYEQPIELARVPAEVMDRIGASLYQRQAHTAFVGEIVDVLSDTGI